MPTSASDRPLIGLDAHLLSLAGTYRSAGISSYILNLLRELPEADSRFFYRAYLHDPLYSPPVGLDVDRSRWNTGSPLRRIAWEQSRLAWAAGRLDLLHGLAFALPRLASCPTIVTVHDLSFMRFPSAFRPFNRLYLSWITRSSTRRATRVIAVSESTRQDIIQFFGVEPDRVVVVPNGVTAEFTPARGQTAVEAFRAAHGLPAEFILFVGTLEPRKNLVRLVDAFAAYRQRATRPIKLIIAGGKGWYYQQLFARVEGLGLQNDVLFPGFIAAHELPIWFQAARVFVYPSLFEGFGLPVLEALACGTPTVTSRISSLPEVTGDAALLVNPEDTEELAAAIASVLDSPVKAAELAAAGPPRAAQFTWRATARRTAGVYSAALGMGGRR
jgi:glycosyltransferase involved in cell wall biosynthesis